eukprot:gene7001-7558_t
MKQNDIIESSLSEKTSLLNRSHRSNNNNNTSNTASGSYNSLSFNSPPGTVSKDYFHAIELGAFSKSNIKSSPPDTKDYSLMSGTDSLLKESHANEVPSSDSDITVNRKPYLTLLLLYILYGISFSILIPALPGLTLRLMSGDAAKSSMLYGTATSIRYFLEFFSAPILGNVADIKGRKIVFILAFVVCAIEFFLLAFFPSVTMIYVTRAMSGLGDAGVATAYAMITDIAVYNNDIVSQQFGILAAMIGLAFIVGPIFGGYLSMISFELCFLVSACLSLLGAILSFIFLEETRFYRSREYSHLEEASSQILLKEEAHPLNPIAGLRIHFSNAKLKKLSFPLALCAINTGLAFMWYIYMKYRFQSTATSIGFYLSFHGLISAIAQGIMIKVLIPKYLSERNTLFYGLMVSACQAVVSGMCNQEWQLYLVSVGFSMGILHFPAIKALIVNESLKTKYGAAYQANLQGAISSIRTASMSIGSLLFTSLFSVGISLNPPNPALPFLAAGVIYLIAYLYLRIDLLYETEDIEEKEVSFSLNVAEGVLGGDENDLLK